MSSSATVIDRLDWADIAAQLDTEGYALLPGLLAAGQAKSWARRFMALPGLQRVCLAGAGLGCGELFHFGECQPEPLAGWRSAFYRRLAPIANRWNDILDAGDRYPAELDEFLSSNREQGQTRPLSHLSRLGEAGYVALHQRSEGRRAFPLQVVALLSEPGRDFQGGEFVMTEQRPRMQSRPMVLPLGLGDAAVIGVAQRPFKGSRGHYRVNLRHAVSRVLSGERIGLELSFHDAP